MIAIVGPTASGKSALALRLARELDAEILSVDSMQVYRGMDIGTAKATTEDRRAVTHHMLDVVEPEVEYDVASFQAAARASIDDVRSRGRTTIIVGGSGLHLRVTVDPFTFGGHDPVVREELEALDPMELRDRLLAADPQAGDSVDLANPRRLIRALEIHAVDGLTPTQRAESPERRAVTDYRPFIPFTGVGIDPGDQLGDRVRSRVDDMLVAGLLDEVEELASRLGRTAAQAVGYKQLLPVVEGSVDAFTGQEDVTRATLALARRQRTYFRRDPRIRWLPWHPDPDIRYHQLVGSVTE